MITINRTSPTFPPGKFTTPPLRVRENILLFHVAYLAFRIFGGIFVGWVFSWPPNGRVIYLNVMFLPLFEFILLVRSFSLIISGQFK